MVNLTKALTRTLAGFLLAAVVAMPVIAGQEMVNAGPDKVAIKGYDTVAYFTEAQATKGRSEFAFSWNDAQWHFANAAHRDMFASNPERYAPQFGGNCSMGLSTGKKVAANPEVWTIVDGKLYLYFSNGARDKFRRNPQENTKAAEANWRKAQ
jgi:YHS domain-containing protein